MHYNTILNVTGKVIKFEAALMVLPLIVAMIYHESIKPFAVAIVIALVLGQILTSFFKDDSGTILIRDGFTIVSLAWISISAIGCLPFIASGEIPNVFDAFFETVSGFTTTGASILKDVEAMSKGLLFWRSFTHWIGGMGILVFVMAISLRTPGRSANILRAEMPGHNIDKLVPKTKNTAIALYLIYMGLTFIEIAFLLAGGMPLYESIVHALGTAGTGGFGVKADSIGSYSAYLQWVVAIFMFLFGINFNYYYLLIFKQGKSILQSNELKWYLIFAGLSTILITALIMPEVGNAADAIRHSFFQVSSIMTTTGYSTVDFNLWPNMAKTTLLMLMFIGGCIGSTAGGLKVSRIVVLGQALKNHMKNTVNPRNVRSVHLNGKIVDPVATQRIVVYFMLYIVIVLIAFFIISFEPFDFETNFTAVIACMSNIGPGFGAVGPAANFAEYTDFSKFILSIVMLIGRLEIYPMLILFAPVRAGRK
ncbi:MAG: TrkH family potassium uptake protein [Clostridiales bacterium]|nr:TrkH family potassium uptake protein [Candidatus Crickella merdequi]